LVDYSWKESSSGPPQKHFQLTSKGEDFLVRLNETWIELVESVNQIITKSRVEAFHHKLPKLEIEALKIKRK
jgi:PadR family transcriptional regulator PadR